MSIPVLHVGYRAAKQNHSRMMLYLITSCDFNPKHYDILMGYRLTHNIHIRTQTIKCPGTDVSSAGGPRGAPLCTFMPGKKKLEISALYSEVTPEG